MLMPRMRTRKHPFAVTAMAYGVAALADRFSALANGFEMVHDYPNPHPIAPHCWEKPLAPHRRGRRGGAGGVPLQEIAARRLYVPPWIL